MFSDFSHLTLDPTPSQKMLVALNLTKPVGAVYQGTVPAAVVRRRRKANRAAALSRRINRRRGR